MTQDLKVALGLYEVLQEEFTKIYLSVYLGA